MFQSPAFQKSRNMDSRNLNPEDNPLIDNPLVPASGGPQPANSRPGSPRWGATTKLVIGLTLVAVSAFLVFRFLNIIGPLLLAFILAYLLYPLAARSAGVSRMPWRFIVTFLYLFLLIVLLGSIALGGFAVVEQLQSLIGFLTNAVQGFPAFITDIASHPVSIGPFVLDLSLLDANAVAQQVLNAVQPILTQAGSSVVSLASGTATVIGWVFFILLISYFILAESGGAPNRLIKLTIPGHEDDVHRLSQELNRIWNAFLRGQVTIVLLTIAIYTILLGSYGLRFFFGLALLAGLARFIPYVGPFIAWTSYGLVAFFQGHTIFGLTPFGYVALVVGTAWVMDVFMDNFVSPRLMSNALRVHPAAVMVSAIVALNLLGVIGMVLAAPVLATVKLLVDYIFAKLFDQDPWANMETITAPSPLPPLIPLLQQRYSQLRERIGKASLFRK